MFKKYLILILFSLICYNSVYSASTKVGKGGREDISHLLGIKQSDFKTGFIAIKKAKKYIKKAKIKKAKIQFNKAIKYLTQANNANPYEPAILELLGFSLKNVGDFDMAEIYFLQGLEVEPNHIYINEHLGELYVVTKRLNMAKDRLKILETCQCEEFVELKTLIEQQ